MNQAEILRAIQKKQNPLEERFLELEKNLKSRTDTLFAELKSKIDAVSDDLVFKDLEPAKKLAEKTAKQEIATFRDEVNEKVKNVLDKIETKKNEIYAKVDAELSATLENMASYGAKMAEELRADTETTHNSYKSKMDEMHENMTAHQMKCKAEMESYILEMRDKVEMMRGPQGEKGEKGENGKDGSPDTGDQIVEKVNKATKKLSLNTIEGLLQEIQNLKQSIRQKKGGSGGGGMGLPIHQSVAVSSATTTASLTYNVAAEGNALWVFYQGQFLVKGTHYTVSGSTLTLLFTPQDNTYLDITYIRT